MKKDLGQQGADGDAAVLVAAGAVVRRGWGPGGLGTCLWNGLHPRPGQLWGDRAAGQIEVAEVEKELVE
jgi:hypothetical protein